MKPYGQKNKKSKLGIHNSDKCHCELCNTKGWKKFKSRDRQLIKTELQLEHEDANHPILQTNE
jgi:predicted RNA-binding protein